MDKLKKQKQVVKAGQMLLEQKLVARTWGNVSCRLNSDTFLITPSGKPYQSLTAKDIVAVNLNDLSFAGPLEPSSETKVHAAVYRLRHEINFIIHTHQANASALSLLGRHFEVNDLKVKKKIGPKICAVPYGPSGSRALMKNVERALEHHQGKAYLLSAHGALCLGASCDEAFYTATCLEEYCANYLEQCYLKLSGKKRFEPIEYSQFYAARFAAGNLSQARPADIVPLNSLKKDNLVYYYTSKPGENCGQAEEEAEPLLVQSLLSKEGGYQNPAFGLAVIIHQAVYKKYPTIKAIIHSTKPAVINYSLTGRKLYPMIEDFAQIIGPSAPLVVPAYHQAQKSVRKILFNLLGRRAVLFKGAGALLTGPAANEARAAEIILEKNCRAAMAVDLCGSGRPLRLHEALFMRYQYLRHYAKKANEKK